MDILEEIEKHWGVSPTNPFKVDDSSKVLTLCFKNLGVKATQSCGHIQDYAKTYIDKLIELQNNLKSSGDFDFETQVRINRVLEMTYYAQNSCHSLSRVMELMDQNVDFTDNSDASLFRFKSISYQDNTKFQNFLLYILAHFYKHNYARYNGDVYKKIHTKDGYNTHAWERVGTITETIYKSVCKETNYDQFINVTHRGDSIRVATDFLSNCSDKQFPQLDKNRRVFSFSNGIYFAKDDNFVEYASDEYRSINSSVVSAKYFDQIFESSENWQNIKTPLFDSLFELQDIDEEILKWVYIFTGRLIYEIDELDGWQVIFFVQGQAGTGKSTYANNICKQFYDEEDVGIMSNNIQKTFGLSDIVDKLLYVAPEIKRDFNIEQGEFQSIISGDKITVNIKYKNSRFETWSIPGVMAGNECPDFIDNAGSIQRRLITLRFVNKIKDGDLMLGRKLKEEMGNIIQKCNKAYRETAFQYGRKNIWTVLPHYFLHTQQELAKATNPLIHFLLSENIVLDSTKFIPEKLFVAAFNEHCKDNNYNKNRFNPDFYMGPFAQHNIKVKYKETQIYEGNKKTGTYFMGVDLRSSEEDDVDCDL